MKRYRVLVQGADNLGWSFLNNVIEVANKGGVVDKNIAPRLTFPHHLMMLVDSEEDLVSKPGIKYVPILQTYTKEQLEEMDWDTFRATVREVGVIGKDRQKMLDKYLETIAEQAKPLI